MMISRPYHVFANYAFLLALIAFLVIFPVGSANASYLCWGPRDIRQEAVDADFVFTGQVYETGTAGKNKEELGTERNVISFIPQQVWKGLEDDVLMVNADVEALYQYNFEVGQSYLVLGYQIYPDRITLIGCPRVKQVEQSERDIRRLGDAEFEVDPKAVEDAMQKGEVDKYTVGYMEVRSNLVEEATPQPEPVIEETTVQEELLETPVKGDIEEADILEQKMIEEDVAPVEEEAQQASPVMKDDDFFSEGFGDDVIEENAPQPVQPEEGFVEPTPSVIEDDAAGVIEDSSESMFQDITEDKAEEKLRGADSFIEENSGAASTPAVREEEEIIAPEDDLSTPPSREGDGRVDPFEGMDMNLDVDGEIPDLPEFPEDEVGDIPDIPNVETEEEGESELPMFPDF